MDIIFAGFLSTIEGKRSLGPKDYVVTRHVITNYVISVKKRTYMMLSWQGPRYFYVIARFPLYPGSLYRGTTYIVIFSSTAFFCRLLVI